MPIPLIPVVVGGLGAAALWRVKKLNYGKMTPERKQVFEQAIKSITDPVKLRKLASSFDKVGLKKEGQELRKRASLREVPDHIKEKRAEAFKKGMASKDPAKVSKLANAFHAIGAYKAAEKLRTYAARLIPMKDNLRAHGDVDEMPIDSVSELKDEAQKFDFDDNDETAA